MKKNKSDSEWIFWTTITISFVMLIHNGTEPLFLFAYASIPILIVLFYLKKSLFPIVLYLLFVGTVGRITQYYHSTYGSDTLLAVRDFIGYFVHGYNVYKEMTMSTTGLQPFTYLPFSLFWYLPAYGLKMDLRFFEMLVSCFVPVILAFYGKIINRVQILPILAVISLAPFLIDLSADGSNDNSAIFILLLSILSFVYAKKIKSRNVAILSAVILGFAASFKHYVFFYVLFFFMYLIQNKKILPISGGRYIFYTVLTIIIVSGPFILSEPEGFLRSLAFIQLPAGHGTWGWNIWVALRDLLQITITSGQMSGVRIILTLLTFFLLFRYFRINALNKVFIASGLTMLVYFAFSQWTTIAYFTFLLPLFFLSAFKIED
ncbi:MAG: hypothetical protein HYV37_02200 [Candidatus Levyibacteriota bacterium]|nr:MAG: hypothetical protein HYV37_02200 [Candidatus Levybacteria bacterium]